MSKGEYSAADVAQEVSAIRRAVQQPQRELTDYESGQLKGARTLAEFVLRELARIPGVPDYSDQAGEDSSDALAPVYPLRPQTRPPEDE